MVCLLNTETLLAYKEAEERKEGFNRSDLQFYGHGGAESLSESTRQGDKLQRNLQEIPEQDYVQLLCLRAYTKDSSFSLCMHVSTIPGSGGIAILLRDQVNF